MIIIINKKHFKQAKNRDLIEIRCQTCRRNFKRTKKRVLDKIREGYKKLYCSKKCLNIGQITSKMVNCKNCKKEFKKTLSQVRKTPNHFCSQSCAASYNNKGKTKNKPKERICKTCGKLFKKTKTHRSILHCQKCTKDFPTLAAYKEFLYKNLTVGEYRNKLSVKGTHPSWTHSHIRSFNRSWNKKMTKLPCKNCEYKKHVELCHIKAITSFDDDTPLKIVNAPDNNVQLCRNCHWEFDHGYLKLKDLKR